MLRYHCERETLCLSQLNFGVQGGNHHVVLGGKNTLKLLVLSQDQRQILRDINLLDSRSKLNNINTIKTNENKIACGLTSGSIALYGTRNNGKTYPLQRLNDHKRCINSLDFPDTNLLISGSQDGTIKLWDLRLPAGHASVTLVSGPHADPVRACQHSPHAPARNKLTILSVHDSGTLHKYDLRMSNQPCRRWNFHTGPALSLSIHPTAEYVLTGSRDHKICVCSYNETSTMPEVTVNTFGPVMKVRWSPYESDADFNTPDLYRYDFACSYLNEVPTIAVYNLRRKFIARELVSTSSDRPFQNFLWAQNPEGRRKLWTITKSNLFMAHDLDDSANVSKPLEQMPSTAVSWSANNLSFVSNYKLDFEAPDVHTSPSVHPVTLPIHDNHSVVAENYLYNVPDGFDIPTVCEFNSNVAQNAGRLRDAHTWRIIGAGFGIETSYVEPEPVDLVADESQSSESELNFGNSSLTLTTHYGGLLGRSRSDLGILKSTSLSNLIDLIKQHRNSSMSLSESPAKRESFTKNIRPLSESFASETTDPPSLRKQSSMPLIANDPDTKLPLRRASSVRPLSTVEESQLSKVLSNLPLQNRLEPWQSKLLVTAALDYSTSQGDLVLACALTLLFYDRYKYLKGFEPWACKERIAQYIDVLHQWRLFSVALAVINLVPKDLEELRALKEVDLRFFCCFCDKVILNENKNKHDFGYWYCDLCSRQQPNCAYCHEPCHGLNVVRSLKCGHRGHFGCLKQWFVEEGNSECPGGCVMQLE